jgi:hypothetical protein
LGGLGGGGRSGGGDGGGGSEPGNGGLACRLMMHSSHHGVSVHSSDKLLAYRDVKKPPPKKSRCWS